MEPRRSGQSQGDLQSGTNLLKKVPIEPVLPEEELLDDKPLKEANLWRNILYTVVPKDHNLALGILPEDQQFHTKYVFLWDDYTSLVVFSDSKWDKVKVIIPEGTKRHGLTKLPGDVYAVPTVPNTWPITLQPNRPFHVE